MAQVIVGVLEVYGVVGAVVAAWFVLLRLDDIDAAARGAFAFRPLLIPGLMLLWPLVLLRQLGRLSADARQLRRRQLRVWMLLSVVLPLLLFGAVALRQNGPTEAAPVRIAPP